MLHRFARTTIYGLVQLGSPAPYHRIAELYFDDQSALGEAGASEEGKAAFAHAGEIASGGVDAMVVQVKDG